MIRLSQVAAFEIDTNSDFSRDLDEQPRLYLYEQNVNNSRVDSLFIQDDASTTSTRRKYSFAPFWQNTLLGTTNFFPEDSTLNLQNYHAQTEMHEILNQTTLSTLEYKTCYLFFTDGFLADANVAGNAIRLFCRLSNGQEITLAAIVDFKNDTQISVVPTKLFESQLFSEALKFEIPDIDFILNSNDVNIVALRTRLFGQERPTKIYIEYASFSQDGIDVYLDNSMNFTRLNFDVINEQTIDVALDNNELFAIINFGTNNAYLRTSIQHQRYDVESYLNTLKEDGATYKVEHYVSVNVYDNNNQLVESKQYVVRDPIDNFAEVQSRPIVPDTADHMNIELTVRIENTTTGLVIRRTTNKIVTSQNIAKYKSADSYVLSNLRNDVVISKTVKDVKQIIQSAEVPAFVQLTKKLYVQVQSIPNEIVLLDATFTTKVITAVDMSTQTRTFLKIDNVVIQNDDTDITTYTIPAIAYTTTSSKYLILDDTNNVILQGKLRK